MLARAQIVGPPKKNPPAEETDVQAAQLEPFEEALQEQAYKQRRTEEWTHSPNQPWVEVRMGLSCLAIYFIVLSVTGTVYQLRCP